MGQNGHPPQIVAQLQIVMTSAGTVQANFRGPGGRVQANAMLMTAMQDLEHEFRKQESGEGIQIARPVG